MKKYNLSNIMKNAWNLYRKAQKWVNKLSFSECLRRAWSDAKQAIRKAAENVQAGLRRMHYGEYKTSYSNCETVPGSYDKATKTIEVYTKRIRSTYGTHSAHSTSGLCPYCHTYCYGDCQMARAAR